MNEGTILRLSGGRVDEENQVSRTDEDPTETTQTETGPVQHTETNTHYRDHHTTETNTLRPDRTNTLRPHRNEQTLRAVNTESEPRPDRR